jgi:hypothetical protein
MTPYTGGGLSFKTKAVTIVNGKRYLLKIRNCDICVHSNIIFDRSPMVCRINLCDLDFPLNIKEKINSTNKYGNSIESRFFYIQHCIHNNLEIMKNDIDILIEDKRILDLHDHSNCYYLTNSAGLYRICDLVYLYCNRDKEKDFMRNTIKERDKIIQLFLK